MDKRRSRRRAQGGGHSSSRARRSSDSGPRGAATRRTTEFMAAIRSVRAAPAACRTAASPAAAAPARPAGVARPGATLWPATPPPPTPLLASRSRPLTHSLAAPVTPRGAPPTRHANAAPRHAGRRPRGWASPGHLTSAWREISPGAGAWVGRRSQVTERACGIGARPSTWAADLQVTLDSSRPHRGHSQQLCARTPSWEAPATHLTRDGPMADLEPTHNRSPGSA